MPEVCSALRFFGIACPVHETAGSLQRQPAPQLLHGPRPPDGFVRRDAQVDHRVAEEDAPSYQQQVHEAKLIDRLAEEFQDAEIAVKLAEHKAAEAAKKTKGKGRDKTG